MACTGSVSESLLISTPVPVSAGPTRSELPTSRAFAIATTGKPLVEGEPTENNGKSHGCGTKKKVVLECSHDVPSNGTQASELRTERLRESSRTRNPPES